MRQAKRIIIEGMDGAGKTTLVDSLMMHVPNLEVIRNDLGPKQNLNVWWPAQLDRQEGEVIPLHDRFFYSELVYGPIIRGHITAEPTLVQNVLWFLRSTALLIYCRPHRDVLREGSEVRTQMEGVPSNFFKLLALYDQLMEVEKNLYGPRFIHYVWDREDEYKNIELLVRDYLANPTGENRG